MAAVRVRDIYTGETGTIDEKEMSPRYEVIDQSNTQQVQAQPQKQSFLDRLLSPFVKTGQNIAGAGFELGRAGLSALGNKNVYVNQETGEEVANPFKTRQELEQFDPNSGGNVLKAILEQGVKPSAGVASWAIPFGKGANLASKVLLPGAGVGGLQAFSEEDSTLGSVGKGALYGAGGAALLHGVLGLGKAAVKGLTGKLPERMMNKTFKEPIKELRSSIKGGETLGKKALDRGVKGASDEAIYKSSVDKISSLEDSLQAKLSGSKRIIPIADIKKTVQPLIDKYLKAGNKTAANDILGRIAELEQYHGKSIPVSVANEIKRTLYDEARNGYGQISSEHIEGIKTIARALKEKIASKVSGIDPINKELSFEGKIADSLLDKMAKGGRNNLFGLADTIIGTGGALAAGPAGLIPVAAKKMIESTAGQTYLANILNKTGNVASKVGSRVEPGLQNLLGQIGGRLPSVLTQEQGNNNNAEPNNYPTHDTIVPQESSVEQNLPAKQQVSYITGHSPEAHYAAYQKAMMAGDKATAAFIYKSYEDEIAYQKTQGGGKNLSGPNSVLVNKAQTAVSSIDRINNVLTQNPNLSIEKALNPLSQEGRLLGEDIRSAIDILGYFRTGAAITADQRKDYIYMFPSALDSKDTAKTKLERLRKEFNGYIQGISMSTGSDDLSAIQSLLNQQ